MNCFVHRHETSLGICCACGKGLCEQCTYEYKEMNVLSCQASKCHEHIQSRHQLVLEAKRINAIVKKDYAFRVVLNLFLAFLFAVFSVFYYVTSSEGFAPSLATFSLIFFISGIKSGMNAKKWPKT